MSETTKDTEMEPFTVKNEEIVATGQRAFQEGRCHSLEFRKEQLRQLKKMYTGHQEEWLQALKKDLGKPSLEGVLMEIHHLLSDIDHILKRLNQWAKSEEVPSMVPFDKSIIYNEPYGLVLVLGAWNYPLQLTMLPVHGAIAAGNAVIVKPSEVAPATADLIAKLVPQYLHRECYQVVLGGVKETTELLTNRFDYIFFTGSTGVGKIVRDAANKHLTPCTLELGGKSPCFIDESVDLEMAVRRIVWGKLINLGQTCIAPDYLMCSKTMQTKFVEKAKEIMREWYGEHPKDSDSLGRIVAERHVNRLAALLDSGTVAHGGKYEKDSRWFEPTILIDVGKDSKIMKEEIFGPILPIVTVETPTEAIQYINKGNFPLAVAIFDDKKQYKNLYRQVFGGNLCNKDYAMHVFSIKDCEFGQYRKCKIGLQAHRFTYKLEKKRRACNQSKIDLKDKTIDMDYHRGLLWGESRNGGFGILILLNLTNSY
ncbi:unnamed protein product, partial [Meganyctiphanes norvegica]